MSDRPDEPERGAGEPKPPKMKAEDNPWYLLATLYGVPGYTTHTAIGVVEPNQVHADLINRNRRAWNRFFAAHLGQGAREDLIYEKRYTVEDLKLFSQDEMIEFQDAFAKRGGSIESLVSAVKAGYIEFSNVEFELFVCFKGFIFINAMFVEATFSRGVDFENATFARGAVFDKATFAGEAFFNKAIISWGASFRRTNFSKGVSFEDAKFFNGAARFQSAKFSHVNFTKAHFSIGGAYFNNAHFFRNATFERATFDGVAIFRRAHFCDEANFVGATFSHAHPYGGPVNRHGVVAPFMLVGYLGGSPDVDFSGTAFDDIAFFTKASFGGISSFSNTELHGLTSFDAATFKLFPPQFFGAKLHQGTVWRKINWPKPETADDAEPFIDAYACLKLEMDRLKKHEDELDFFALEMQSRRVLLGPWRGWPIWLYGVLSGYGRSYVRPLVAMFVVVAIGVVALWCFDARTFAEALGLSAANTLNVFGFHKVFNLAIETPFALLYVLAALQTILGTILLFLFGLGVRNKFRMK